MLEISSTKYKAEKKVLVDGDKSWTVRLPGARDELALSQAQRRITLLEAKVTKGVADEDDLDKMEKLESTIFDTYLSLITDETEDNSQVKQFLTDTPMAIVQMFLVDIKKQSEDKEITSGKDTTS